MGGAPEALLTAPCHVCFKFVLWRPATGKKEKKERERDQHHYGQKDVSPDLMQSTLNDILRNPPPKNTKKIVFLNPDFITTS